jgi:hypothetical protein
MYIYMIVYCIYMTGEIPEISWSTCAWHIASGNETCLGPSPNESLPCLRSMIQPIINPHIPILFPFWWFNQHRTPLISRCFRCFHSTFVPNPTTTFLGRPSPPDKGAHADRCPTPTAEVQNHWYAGMYILLCTHTYLSIHMHIYLSIYLSLFLSYSVCLSVRLSIYLSICTRTCTFIRICICKCLYVYVSMCIYIYTWCIFGCFWILGVAPPLSPQGFRHRVLRFTTDTSLAQCQGRGWQHPGAIQNGVPLGIIGWGDGWELGVPPWLRTPTYSYNIAIMVHYFNGMMLETQSIVLTGAKSVGNGWVAGGCWDDDSSPVDHSLIPYI